MRMKAETWYSKNRDRRLAASKAWHAANPGPGRLRALKWQKENADRKNANSRKSAAKARLRRYGLTEESYNQMLLDQDNSCAICKTTDWGEKGPELDHDHVTDEHRGILCGKCNRGIGLLDDSTALLFNAIDYLEKHYERTEIQRST